MKDIVQTIGGHEYNFKPMSVKKAMNIESRVIALLQSAYNAKTRDHDELYELGKILMSGMLVDDVQIDIDEHFAGKTLEFNQVVFAALKLNFPDFFQRLESLKDSGLYKKITAFVLASVQSQLTGSSLATKTDSQQSAQSPKASKSHPRK